MLIRRVEPGDRSEWMRAQLWPDSPDDHEPETAALLSAPADESVVLVAERPNGRLAAFLEAGKRECAEGSGSSPVGFIEGWWVESDARRDGLGVMLVAEAEEWARAQGVTEMASDAEIDNKV